GRVREESCDVAVATGGIDVVTEPQESVGGDFCRGDRAAAGNRKRETKRQVLGNSIVSQVGWRAQRRLEARGIYELLSRERRAQTETSNRAQGAHGCVTPEVRNQCRSK